MYFSLVCPPGVPPGVCVRVALVPALLSRRTARAPAISSQLFVSHFISKHVSGGILGSKTCCTHTCACLVSWPLTLYHTFRSMLVPLRCCYPLRRCTAVVCLGTYYCCVAETMLIAETCCNLSVKSAASVNRFFGNLTCILCTQIVHNIFLFLQSCVVRVIHSSSHSARVPSL